MTGRVQVIRHGSERLRAGSWRGLAHVAYVAPLPEAANPSAHLVRHTVRLLADQGYTEAVTGALTAAEQRGFLDAGFTVREELHLLVHDLRDLPDASQAAALVPADARLRRARRGDRPAVLEVDTAAFDDFWQLDDSGLDEALTATPTVRFRVAEADSGAVVGYAICGRAGRRGYVQRLAVHPGYHGRGLGAALLTDGLRWLRRRGAAQAAVNTQLGNDAALELYERAGFRRQTGSLAVLARAFGDNEDRLGRSAKGAGRGRRGRATP